MLHLVHLINRSLQVILTRPLSPADQIEVAGLLHPREAALFWSQPAADQRHGLRCARSLTRTAPERHDLAAAALLHDLGKRGPGLGPLGRSLASALALARIPTRGRLAAYLEHGPAGAVELEAIGTEAIAVAYARHHHHGRPIEVSPADWELLVAADLD
jgi:hypothetical protein